MDRVLPMADAAHAGPRSNGRTQVRHHDGHSGSQVATRRELRCPGQVRPEQTPGGALAGLHGQNRLSPLVTMKRGRHGALIASSVPPTLHGRQATLGMREQTPKRMVTERHL